MKRFFDLATSALALLVSSPILAGSAAAIVLEDRGPVLYRQRRVGKDGVEFELLKLRTMVVGAETIGAGLAVNEGDPRITKVGAVLRRLSLDELPQLLNVLNGTMSLVAPRPHLAAEVARMPQEAQRRSTVKPGLTGLWQINGRSNLGADEAVRLDIRYVDTWSLKLDLLILLGTIPAVVTARGAH